MINYCISKQLAVSILLISFSLVLIESGKAPQRSTNPARNVHNCGETAGLAIKQLNQYLNDNYTLDSFENCQFLGTRQEFMTIDISLKKDTELKECQGLRIWLRQYKEHPINITSYGSCATQLVTLTTLAP